MVSGSLSRTHFGLIALASAGLVLIFASIAPAMGNGSSLDAPTRPAAIETGQRSVPSEVTRKQYEKAQESFVACLRGQNFQVVTGDDLSGTLAMADASFPAKSDAEFEEADLNYQRCYNSFGPIDEAFQLQNLDRVQSFYRELNACTEPRGVVVGLSLADQAERNPVISQCILQS